MKSNKKRNYFLMIALAITVIGNYSCEKSESPVTIGDFSMIKMYDDTLASGENSNIRISSRWDRLYMTYGSGTSYWPSINGVIVPGQSELTNTLMCADLKGNIIWKTILPKGLAAGTPLGMDDGSCWIIAANLWGYGQLIPTQTIYMFHFDSQGNQLKKDTFFLPSNFGGQYTMTTLDMIRSNSGNILIYGSVNNYIASISGFAMEYNVNTGVEWTKQYVFRPDPNGIEATTSLHNCITTSDGGYIFLGTYYDYPNIGRPDCDKTILIKTDANGDTVWTKWYDYFKMSLPTSVPVPGNIIQLKNGGYRFCTNDNPDDDYKKYRAFIYEVNSTGDSVNAYTINQPDNAYCPYIINDDGGNTHALINTYPAFLVSEIKPVFSQINTRKYVCDSSMNLTAKSKLQSERSDFLTSACMTSEGVIAVFGLFSTSNGRSYVPGLIYLR